jgi:hypothetical protein
MSRIPPATAASAREIRGGGNRFIYLTSTAPEQQPASQLDAGLRSWVHRCYHHIEVRPQTIGRVLGIGLRVAGRVAGQRIMGEGQTATNAAESDEMKRPAAADAASRGRVAGQATRGVARGVGGFLRPFGRVGSKIWLEVSGVFFLLPVLVFTPTLWRTRFSYLHGPDHRLFVSSAIVVVLFLYLGVSSFWRAGKK